MTVKDRSSVWTAPQLPLSGGASIRHRQCDDEGWAAVVHLECRSVKLCVPVHAQPTGARGQLPQRTLLT